MTSVFSFDYSVLYEPILEPFRSEAFGPKLATLLLASAALVLILFIVSAGLQAYRLRSALAIIVGTTSGNSEEDKRRTFLHDYQKIDSSLAKNKALEGPWQEFRKTLIFRGVGDARILFNPTPPRTLITPRALRVQYDFVRSLPNLFVGLGLLGTFVGLIAALTFSTQSLTSAVDQEQIKQALKVLLTTAAAKFYISAAGLLSSITLALSIRVTLKYLHGLANKISEAVAERILFLTGEALAERQLTVQQSSLEELRLFNTNVAMKVGDAVRSAVEASNQTLTTTLTDIAEKFSRVLDSSRDGASGAINDAMKSALDATLREASQAISSVASSLQALPDRVNEAASTLKAAGEAARQQQSDIMETLQGGLQKLLRETTSDLAAKVGEGTGDLISNLKGVGTSFGESASKISAFLEGMGANAVQYEKSMNSLTEQNAALGQHLSEISSRLADASENVSKASRSVDGNLTKLLNWSDNFTRLADQTLTASKTSQETILATVSKLQEQMETHVRRFDDVDGKLATVFANIATHLELQSTKMSEHFTQMDQALASAVNQFETIIDDLVEYQSSRRAAE